MTVAFNEDVHIQGTLVPRVITLPNDAITSSNQVKAGANLNADKTESRVYPSYSQPNSASTTETRTLFVARRPGTLNEVRVGSIAKAVGDSTVTVDVKKNGTTILSAVVTLNSSNTNRITVAGALAASGAFVAADWFEVVITATIGTGTLPTGVFIQLEVDQDGA